MSVLKNTVSLAVLAAALAPAAFADTAAATDDQSLIETVVVTAQKREQNPVDVPFALTAYSGKFMKDVGIQEFDKLSLFVPGFVVQNQSPNNPGFGLRGLTLDSGDPTQEPRVSVFEDGVSISTTRATYIELFDIERIEVAKGPQTTLFGRAALMGGVNVIQNKAKTDKFDAGASLEYGNYNYRMLEGMVNVPVSDSVAVRVAARYKARDGYVKNLGEGDDYNSVDTVAARVSLTWQPNEAFGADVIFNYENDRPSGTSFKSGTFAPADSTTGSILGTTSPYTGAALTNSVAGFEDGKELGLDRKVWDAKVQAFYKLTPSLTLNSITAYRRFDSEEVFDPDGFAQPLMQAAEDERGDQFSQELRLNFDNGGRLTAFGGVDYFYSSVSQRVPLQMDEFGVLALSTWGTVPAYSTMMFNLLQYAPTATMDASMQSFAASYLYSNIYPSYYSAYYANYYAYFTGLGYPAATADALASSYGSSGASAATTSVSTGLAGQMKTNHWEESTLYGKTKSVDLFLDATYKVTDDFEVEAGIRYTHDDKTSSVSSRIGDRSVLGILMNGSLASVLSDSTELNKLLASTAVDSSSPDALIDYGILSQPTANNGDKISKSFTDSGVSWRVALRYSLDETSNVYFNYARGRRPKVLSAATPSTPYGDPTFTPVAAETVDSYELGYKTIALDGKLHADVAIYLYDYTHFQTTTIENLKYVTNDAGEARSYGFESSLDWAVAPWADLFATYSYSHARFTGDTIYKDNMFRLNPDHKLSLGMSLRADALGGTFNFMPTYTWQSKIFFDDDNDRADLQTTAAGHLIADTVTDEVQDAYGLLNLRLTWQQEGAPWSVALFVNNALDQNYIKDAGNSGDNLGIPTFIKGEPRFFGVNLTWKMQ